jgi:hypothetical protein
MTDYHFSRAKDGDITYCKECFAIMEVEYSWVGDIKIGKMEKSYKVASVGLDIKHLIEDHLGTTIDLTNVVLVEGDWHWDRKFEVGFFVGKSMMFGDITARRNEDWEVTDKVYTLPEPTEEEVEA